MPATESGVRVYGEQRGAALADFDQDGRIDLCVSQNGAATRLFRNVRGRPGVRIRLQGPPGNPTGVGAQVRCSHVKGVKEIHAGSGYWSQNSAILGFPPPAAAAEVSVRWPGGVLSVGRMSPGEPEVVVKYPSKQLK